MQFSLTAAVLALATTVAALPPADVGGKGIGNGAGNKGNADVKFPVPDDITVKQAQAKCGDQAELSCCNKATYAGDTTTIDDGLLAGALSNLIGAGSGAEGLGLFDQCSKLPLQSKSLMPSTHLDQANHRSPHLGYRSQRPHQPAVQAEHRLLPELPLLCRRRPHWPGSSLHRPRLHHLSLGLPYLFSHWPRWKRYGKAGGIQVWGEIAGANWLLVRLSTPVDNSCV
ncbi:hypothetical protein MW887_011895 [Aspergillus wentii]|nr:hypothetical protein MW887_011895 [Aspergillus wentii]